MEADGHQPGDMSHVHHQVSIHGPGDCGKSLEIDCPRIGTGAGDNHPGPVPAGQLFHLIVIYPPRVAVDPVMHKVVEPAGKTDPGPMGQVPAVAKFHGQDGITGLQQSKIARHVGLGAGVRLDIDILCSKQGSGPFNGQPFGPVHVAASAVIAFVRITFGILVGKDTALDLHDRPAGDIFRSNQLQVFCLALSFRLDGPGYFGINLAQRC